MLGRALASSRWRRYRPARRPRGGPQPSKAQQAFPRLGPPLGVPLPRRRGAGRASLDGARAVSDVPWDSGRPGDFGSQQAGRPDRKLANTVNVVSVAAVTAREARREPLRIVSRGAAVRGQQGPER
ncbi:hypothetical protein GCM10010521_12140 [Streptomyces rameus]|uniref:Uncharacterized protein n=1 Tax=Streptomyces rameus TaxID=68261 RepID=A0ABP6MYF2_9ACTN